MTPVLGVVSLDAERSFVMADIPGLIEGASQGTGLGDEFLRHVERTKVLIHVLDAAGSEGRDPINDSTLLIMNWNFTVRNLLKRNRLLQPIRPI